MKNNKYWNIIITSREFDERNYKISLNTYIKEDDITDENLAELMRVLAALFGYGRSNVYEVIDYYCGDKINGILDITYNNKGYYRTFGVTPAKCTIDAVLVEKIDGQYIPIKTE